MRVDDVAVSVHEFNDTVAECLKDESFENEALIEGILGSEGLETAKT